MVTPEQVERVQSSWAKVEPITETAAELFYGKLFELNPSLKILFPDDMVEQKKKLMQTLAVCVNGLTDLGEIVPAVQTLGKRHVDYKVRNEDYDTVGQALLWALEQGLGEAWNPTVKDAWAAVYGVLASTMIEAAEQNSSST